MSETAVRDALEELVDACVDEHGDWEDVLRRAAARRERMGRQRRRRALALGAGVALLVGLVATPAFGLRDAVLDLIGREEVSFEQAPPAPTVVKRQFADLALGAPRGMDPQVIPGRTRTASLRIIGGRARTLYVAPTRLGGFCYLIEGYGGGCRPGAARDPAPVLSPLWSMSAREGESPRVRHVGGTLRDARATRIVVRFGDGHEVELPFVWISAPISAAFFGYDVPAARQQEARGPVAMIASAADGRELARAAIHYPSADELARRRAVFGRTPRHRALPTRPPVAPTPPLQRATAGGVTVVVGRNGAASFDASGIDAGRRRLLAGRAASYSCFRIVTRYGETYARGYGVAGRFGTRVGAHFSRLGRLDDARSRARTATGGQTGSARTARSSCR